VEEEMTANAVSPEPFADLIAGPTTMGIVADALDRGSDLTHVRLGLVDVPALLGELPDRREVALRGRGEAVRRYAFIAALKASKSKASGTPLFSPSMRAARSAASCVSWSSSNRRPARMTSLADR